MEHFKEIRSLNGKKVQVTVLSEGTIYYTRYINTELDIYDPEITGEDNHYGSYLRDDNGDKLTFDTVDEAVYACSEYFQR